MKKWLFIIAFLGIATLWGYSQPLHSVDQPQTQVELVDIQSETHLPPVEILDDAQLDEVEGGGHILIIIFENGDIIIIIFD